MQQAIPTVVVALIALTAASACSDGQEAGTPQSSPSVRDTDSSSASPSAVQSPTGAPDLSTFGEERLEPGPYAFSPFGSDPEMPIPVMKVPDGFAAFRGFGVSADKGPVFRSIAVWTVDAVDLQPCKPSGSTPIGPSPLELVETLSRQQLTTTSSPTSVELGEYHGLYIEVSAPSGRDFSECAGTFDLWSNDGGGMRYLQAPGQVDRLWILDLPGERLVIDATTTPGATAAQVRQLKKVVRSVRFQEPAPL